MGSLLEDVRQFAQQLRKDHGHEIPDPRAFKKRVVRLFRQALPPAPGRPRHEDVTRALKLRDQGVPWLEVYRLNIPNFSGLQAGERGVAMSGLRSAVRSRRRRRMRAKKPAAKLSRQEIAP